MNQSEILERQPSAGAHEVDVIGLLIAVAKHKKRIAVVTLAAAALSVAAAFALPPSYQATTKLLPPQQSQSSASLLLSQLGGLAGAAGAGGGGLKNPNDLYIGILQSRTLADRIISDFNLKKVYETDSQETARHRLELDTKITGGKEGLITIEVEAADKKLVAPLANAYVNQLFNLMKTLAVTDASQRRLFYERQLAAARDNLAKAETVLKSTMDTQGMVSVDAESRAILETVARLRAQASAKEIQLTSMRAFLTPVNPEYRRAEEELVGLRAELAKLENGRGTPAEGADKAGGLKNITLLRELKYQQTLYETLAKQYEVARLDEAKDPPMIQVLDPAVEPERKAKPRRAMIVGLSTALALLAAVCWAIVAEWRRKVALTPEGAAQLAELKSHLAVRQK
jgi:uncharacterized protein involved in exopolysaccharide biosynthesis